MNKKNLLKQIMTNSACHLIFGMRSKTEYVIELNDRGKNVPMAVGLKEDMQGDVRYEFDLVLSLNLETHNVKVVKDRIGYKEIRDTMNNPEKPITVEDGELLGKLTSEGMSYDEIQQRKRNTYITFILNEKASKATKIATLEKSQGTELTKELLDKLPYEKLEIIAKYLK